MTFVATMRDTCVACAVAACALVCTSPPCVAQSQPPAGLLGSGGDSSEMKRRVRFSFTLQNDSAQPIAQATLSVYAPVRLTSYQRLEALSASLPAEVQVDPLGNQILRLRIDTLAPYASRVVTVDAELAIGDKPHGIANPEALLALFSRPERYIESDSPKLKEIARSLRAESAMQTAQRTFVWVRQSLAPTSFTAEDRGALRALEDRAGDCTEHAYLFVALLRANGVPARTVGGYLAPESGLLRPHDYHNWAEFYAHGAWHLADPHQGNFARDARKYIATRVLSSAVPGPLGASHRYAVAGPGLRVTMN